MSQNDDFISFEKALRDLNMQSEQLKKLVSEGEIRAFRDGDSMKFKREDLDSLKPEDDALVFAESLEDDTGMVTEELSDADTLLAEDDLLEDDDDDAPAATTRAASGGAAATVAARPRPSARARADEAEDSTEPVWVTAAAILAAVVMLYGLMVCYTTAMGTTQLEGLMGMWAPKAGS